MSHQRQRQRHISTCDVTVPPAGRSDEVEEYTITDPFPGLFKDVFRDDEVSLTCYMFL